jgi:hypothetical protein
MVGMGRTTYMRQVQAMCEIQKVMTPAQRDTWWNLMGEPAGCHTGLLKRRCLVDLNDVNVEK